MEEFIRLLDSVENILEPLKAEASFLEKVRRYYSLTAYQRYVVLKGEAKDLVDKFFSYRLALDDLPLYPPFVFDEIINKVRNETKDMVKLYLKEKKYFSKLAEAGAKYRKLESLSKNLENNWKSILEMDSYFKALKPESALLREIKERALKFLSSLKPQLQKVLNEKLSYLKDFLKKVDEVKDRGSLGNLYADYVNKITPLFKEDFPYPLYQSIKEMVKKIGRKINEKFQEFERKEKEEELIAQISPLVKGLKEEKRKLEDSLQNLSPDRAMEMIEKFIMKTDHLIGKVENFLNKYTSSKVEKLMDELENLKGWADRLFEEIKEKSETERAVFKIKNLYHSFAYYYESKNLGALLNLLSDDWEAYDGTTVDDVEETLSESFDMFDRIKYKISNLKIEPQGKGKYRVTYTNEIKGYIYSQNLVHRESYKVVEIVGKEGGSFKILKTIEGAFWRR